MLLRDKKAAISLYKSLIWRLLFYNKGKRNIDYRRISRYNNFKNMKRNRLRKKRGDHKWEKF